MIGIKVRGGRALGIAIGIAMLVLLMTGGAGAATITVNASGGADYTRIQDAINAASTGDTILVYSGIYYENVNVYKQLNLSGINSGGGKPVVDAGGNGTAITLSANGSILDGFDARNSSGQPWLENGGNGEIVVNSDHNVIKNNNASNNFWGIISYYIIGIKLNHSNNNIVSDNNASYDGAGITLFYSGNNSLAGNLMSGNVMNFAVWGDSYSDFNNSIDASNKVNGKPIYYIKNANSQVYDNSTNAGTFYCIRCNNVTVQDLILATNGNPGIYLWQTQNSRIKNTLTSNNILGSGIVLDSSDGNSLTSNIASNNSLGIYLYNSNNNTLIDNAANSDNYDGIDLYNSNNNTINGSFVSNNNFNGIDLYNSNNNTINGNFVSNNTQYGIYLGGSGNNTIYNNYLNNAYNFANFNSVNTLSLTKTPGTNIIGGPYLGGNFWANPSGTGFSQTCADGDGDGICDSAYTLDSNNIDYLPLASNFIQLSGSIIGKFAYSNNGTGIGGVTVNLTNASGVVATTTTNSSGGYGFTNVITGNYNINASNPGFFGNSTNIVVASTSTVNLILWMKGDLNNNGLPEDAGDLVLMKRAAIGEIAPGSSTVTPAFTYNLNNNGVIADAGDLVLMKRAAICEIILS